MLWVCYILRNKKITVHFQLYSQTEECYSQIYDEKALQNKKCDVCVDFYQFLCIFDLENKVAEQDEQQVCHHHLSPVSHLRGVRDMHQNKLL